MKGTIKIFSYAGIPILIHWTFLFLALFIGYYGWMMQFSQTAFLMFCSLFVLLFVCVIFHELGHAIMAKRFSINTKDIILLPVGGVARLERLPKAPKQEFLISAAGPFVNLLIALLIAGVCFFIDGEIGRIFSRRGHLIWQWEKLLPLLFYINISLFVLNLIPAFPLDGGRIFRALASFLFGRKRATQLSSWVGQLLGLGIITYGIYIQHTGILIIGGFLLLMTRNAYHRFKFEQKLFETSITDLMTTNYSVLYIDNDEVLITDLVIGEDTLVVDKARQELLGVLPKVENIQIQNWEAAILKKYTILSTNLNALEAIELLQKSTLETLPILSERGTIIGVVSLELVFNSLED